MRSKLLALLALAIASFMVPAAESAVPTLFLRLTMPRRMINDRTQTVRADLVDGLGRIQTAGCSRLGTISAHRIYGGADIPLTVTVFDDHLEVPPDSIRFYNGVGSVSFTLDGGTAVAPGEIEVEVELDGVAASKRVTLQAPPAYRQMSGTLSGADLVWGPDENIRITGNVEVPQAATLTIHEGTLVLVDTTGGNNDGTLITVDGAVSAVGTAEKPIHFFSERGPLAMTLTQSGSHSNVNAWQGITHNGNRTSTYTWVIVTGAGNGQVLVHPRPPVFRLNDTHGMVMDHCVFADDNGMAVSTPSRGTTTIQNSLFSRCGIGGEFAGNGGTLLLEDSYFTSIGRAPEPLDLDGDMIHLDGARSTQTVRRCVFNDGGDDGIDHSDSSFVLEDSILSDFRDKAVSLTGGLVTASNVLVYGNGTGGFRGDTNCTHCTIATASPLTIPHSVQETIIWTRSISTCNGEIDYTIVGKATDATCGTGNLSVDPLYRDPGSCDYNPAAGSPALTAGPTSRRIGWLGYPSGTACGTAAECADGNPCTTDTCGTSGVCENVAIDGCVPCAATADCDDGNPCTVDACGAGGTCTNGAGNDGAACDDGIPCTADTCSAGACVGVEGCPPGSSCDPTGVCGYPPVTVSFRNDGTYAGTQDTWLGDDLPNVPNGARDHFRWDIASPAQEWALIRFDGIFGTGPGQIPDTATIGSATLTVNVFNGSTGTAGEVHDSAVDWSEETSTWNNFGGEPAVQPDEIGPFVAPAPMTGLSTVDVTASLVRWLADPSTNHGWIFVPTSTDEARAYSSEALSVANRPELAVTYFAPVPCLLDGDCNDGIFCNGAELCVSGLCASASAAACDDGIGCTVDSCDEGAGTCAHVANNAICDDGVGCNGVETCGAAGCASGTASPLPVEVAGMSVTGKIVTTLQWVSQGSPIRYDVASGSIASLRPDGGVAGATCLVDDVMVASYTDTRSAPIPQDGYYYMLRAQDDCATGTYGFSTAGIERLPLYSCP